MSAIQNAGSTTPVVRVILILIAGVVLAAGSLSLAVLSGSVPLDWRLMVSGQMPLDDPRWAILFDLRLPRAIAAFSIGGLLALAGLLMQALLRNPLADPYILGISGGAGLGGVVAAVFAPALAVAWLMPLGAGLGALLVVVLVFSLAARSAVYSLERLILIGVAVSSLCAALVSLMLTFSEAGLFRGLVFWLLGELSGSGAEWLAVAWGLALLVCLPLARAMNMLVLGDDLALSLGVPVRRLRWALYWIAALATGVAVSAGGMIGFVGLVVPHALRLSFGVDHRALIPLTALAGGIFLTLADLVARTVIAPMQLPVGVVTALIGAPVFILLLTRRGVHA